MQRAAIDVRPPLRREVRRTKLKLRQGRDRARLRKLLFAWIRF
jgi:hypothetical protein